MKKSYRNLLLVSGVLTSTLAQAEVKKSFSDGFEARGTCHGGHVAFGEWDIFGVDFPGKHCKQCCGGVEVEIELLQKREDGRGTVRCVRWYKLGKRDDISVAHWFEESGNAGWKHYGETSFCKPH